MLKRPMGYARWVVLASVMAGAFVACSSDDDDDGAPLGGAGSGGQAGDGAGGTNPRAGSGGEAGEGKGGGAGIGGASGAGAGGMGGEGGCSVEDECGGCGTPYYAVLCGAGTVVFEAQEGDEDEACVRAQRLGEGGSGGAGGGGGTATIGGEGGASAGICDTYVSPGTRITSCGSCTETSSETKARECLVAGECCVVVKYSHCGI